MSKKPTNTDDQMQLFSDNKSSYAEEAKEAQKRFLDRINAEDALIRSSFTSKEEYYLSPQWRSKRLEKLRQAGNKCEYCGRVGRLDVHHLHYDNLYNERMSDLQVLCRGCHWGADASREHRSAYTSYLHTKYGDEFWKYDCEREHAEFESWIDRQCYY